MLDLFLKDVLVQKKRLIEILIEVLVMLILVCVLQFFGAPCVYIVSPFLLATSFILYGCGFGEKNDVDVMINSLPVSRKEIVLSKYISVFIFFIAGVIITIAFSAVVRLTGFSHIGRFINFQDILASFVFTILYSSIYLPVYLWVGHLKSQLFNSILTLCTYILLICAVMMITLIDNGTAKKPIMDFVSLLGFKSVFFSSCILFLIIVFFISAIVSLKIYQNRDL